MKNGIPEPSIIGFGDFFIPAPTASGTYWKTMPSQKTLLLVRHGRIGNKFDGRFVGSTDVPLATEHTAEITALARNLGEKWPTRCICSPLKRARQTAEILAKKLDLTIELDPDLREIDFGRWEGLSFEEIATSDPELIVRWNSWDDEFAFPEGESIGDFLRRVKRVGDRIKSGSDETILLVSHGGFIRSMICYLLGLSDRQYVLFDVKRASLTTIDIIDGRGVLTGLNASAHLGG
jgi:alpha-ribazole phosphatase